jgi:hypothetical protein
MQCVLLCTEGSQHPALYSVQSSEFLIMNRMDVGRARVAAWERRVLHVLCL